jgi:hypothetical protein
MADLGAHCTARPMMTAAGSVITLPWYLSRGEPPAEPWSPPARPCIRQHRVAAPIGLPLARDRNGI